MNNEDTRLMEHMSAFLKKKGYPIGYGINSVPQMLSEFIKAARNTGSEKGAADVDNYLKERLMGIQNLCKKKDFSGICQILDEVKERT